MDTRQRFEELINDHSSGSSELLRRTIDWILAAFEEGQDASTVQDRLDDLCREHPSMALLRNLRAFFERIAPNPNRVKAWLDMYVKHESAACRLFAAHLSNFKNILIHSNSGVIGAALAEAPSQLNIFCTEGRPAFEGRMMAQKLSRTRHRVFLIADMAAFSVIPRVEIVAFGCDAVTPRGFVNKIGTCAIAASASAAGKKVYFVASTEKCVDDWSEDFLLRHGPPEEIYGGSDAIHVENYYFDLTPPQLTSGVFLETGLKDNYFA
jgi:translation initiation factor 2B subunit (eIF-2B alpha/beta/delta family)